MACSAPMIDRSILREVKSGPYMLKAGFQKGPMELRTCPLDVSPLACVSDLPWRLVAAQHPPPYPEALKFHVKCNFMKFHEISTPCPGFHEILQAYLLYKTGTGCGGHFERQLMHVKNRNLRWAEPPGHNWCSTMHPGAI